MYGIDSEEKGDDPLSSRRPALPPALTMRGQHAGFTARPGDASHCTSCAVPSHHILRSDAETRAAAMPPTMCATPTGTHEGLGQKHCEETRGGTPVATQERLVHWKTPRSANRAHLRPRTMDGLSKQRRMPSSKQKVNTSEADTPPEVPSKGPCQRRAAPGAHCGVRAQHAAQEVVAAATAAPAATAAAAGARRRGLGSVWLPAVTAAVDRVLATVGY